jgi:hypothetical protein
MITPLIHKKIKILHRTFREEDSFYFEFRFDGNNRLGLCYDFGYNKPGRFEICYVDLRDDCIQERTYL